MGAADDQVGSFAKRILESFPSYKTKDVGSIVDDGRPNLLGGPGYLSNALRNRKVTRSPAPLPLACLFLSALWSRPGIECHPLRLDGELGRPDVDEPTDILRLWMPECPSKPRPSSTRRSFGFAVARPAAMDAIEPDTRKGRHSGAPKSLFVRASAICSTCSMYLLPK